jgi:RNA polymerase sigma factor (sigma-70 family)
LLRLRAGDSSAWRSFLAQYASLLVSVVRAHTRDGDMHNDLFLHVCEALSDNHFARLQKFDPHGPARFTTWLRVVTTNLCIDLIRKRKGRDRPFASVAKLPAVERALFHLRFERRLERAACFAALRANFPDLTEERFANALVNLERGLTPEQRWRASVRQRSEVPLEHAFEETNGESTEATAADHEAELRLASALERLEATDRLLLAYRYEQDLTFEQIARLMNLGDAFRARRHVQAALERLSHLYEQK